MILLAIFMMALLDILSTLLVIAEARDWPWAAAILDGLKDWPATLGAGISGYTLAKKGFGSEVILCFAISITSVISTRFAMYIGRRIEASKNKSPAAQ